MVELSKRMAEARAEARPETREETRAGAWTGLAAGLAALTALAPGGYFFGLHIREARATHLKSTLSPAWLKIYNAHNYLLRDPVVFWGSGATGTLRWSEIRLPDPSGVFTKAAAYGLRFGAASSCGPITSRSIVSMARSDREFSGAELLELTRITEELHAASAPKTGLTQAQSEALRAVARGDRHADAARVLGISESAFKARLLSVRQRLDARSTLEAIRKAQELRLL